MTSGAPTCYERRMRWDASRPVPWRRLVREWLVYLVVMVAVMFVAFRDQLTVGLLAGLMASGPMYLLIGSVLAKFGYQRTTLRDLRAQRLSGDGASSASTAATRTRPAPTTRTGGPAPTRRTGASPSRRSAKRR